MVVVISRWAMDGCCYFLVSFGWLLLFLVGLRMILVNSGLAVDGCG